MTSEVRLSLRLPEDLHAQLLERARVDERSLNREIVALLRQALAPRVDADAYRGGRATLRTMPEYRLPRPIGRLNRRREG